MTIHDINEEKMINLLEQVCSFIRSHDSSYEKNLVQADRVKEIISNLTRYANAIQERMEKS